MIDPESVCLNSRWLGANSKEGRRGFAGLPYATANHHERAFCFRWKIARWGVSPQAHEVLPRGPLAEHACRCNCFYTSNGIHSVPAVIVNDRHLISGGQPVDVFEQALRRIAAGEV